MRRAVLLGARCPTTAFQPVYAASRFAISAAQSAVTSTMPARLASDAAGSLYVWGKVEDARMGMRVDTAGSTITQVTMGPEIGPTRHALVHDAAQVVCRAAKTLVRTHDGAVYSWGTCENLSLGHGPGITVVQRPRRIEALAGIRVAYIAAGETACAAVSDEGDVYTWGWGGSFWQGNGGLGHGDNVSQPHPALVQWLEDAHVRVRTVSVGSGHMLAVANDGKVLSWGNGEYGRCGNGRRKQLVPEVVELLEAHPCVAVAAGFQHSLALTAAGHVYAWGKNDAGQLGQGGNIVMDLNTMEEYPLAITLESDDAGVAKDFNGGVATIAAGGNISLAVTRSGKLFQWGGRTFLTPSIVEFGYLRAPVKISDGPASAVAATREESTPLRARSVEAGDGVAALIDADGQLFTWGKNLNTGMLGRKEYSAGSRLPVRVEALSAERVVGASFGSKHAAAVTTPRASSTAQLSM